MLSILSCQVVNLLDTERNVNKIHCIIIYCRTGYLCILPLRLDRLFERAGNR